MSKKIALFPLLVTTLGLALFSHGGQVQGRPNPGPANTVSVTGSVTSQGDAAMYADVFRANFGVSGTGFTVGVLSNSYNCLGGAAADVASGDLPAAIQVLDDTKCSEIPPEQAKDEGRAMMQIIHDVAPGASQMFHTAYGGPDNFIQGIFDLYAAGSKVIVDDVIYPDEPMFLDGLIAQAVDTVVAGGTAYFAAAGNNGRLSYESPFRDNGESIHDFDPGPGVDVFQRITIPAGAKVTIVLQWDDPFLTVHGPPGAGTNLNFFLWNDPPTAVLASSTASNMGFDPVEFIIFTNSGGEASFNLQIVRSAGPNPPMMKYVIFGAVTINDNYLGTGSSTIYGHFGAAGAQTVGAAAYFNTPKFGLAPPSLEPFSSAGPVQIRFNTLGLPIPPVTRNKPDIVGPDGVNTTFFGFDIPHDEDTFPNFFGTSAAAPHAAGMAALMLQARPTMSPAAIYQAMKFTGVDMEDPFYDFDSGFGLVNADAVLCLPPSSGTWTVANSCTFAPFAGTAVAPASVIVEPNKVLTIGAGKVLDINFGSFHLRVRTGGKAIIKDGGKIQ